MRKKIFAGLVGLIGTALIAGACNIKFDNKGKTITPKGDAITETRNIGTFDKIDVRMHSTSTTKPVFRLTD